MKDEVVARLRELRAKATLGPWTPSVEPNTYANGKHWYVVLDDEENGIGEFYGDDHEANSANVRLAAEAPAMADLIEQQALLIEELREGLEYIARRDGKDESGQTNWQKSVDRIQDVARSLLQGRRG